MFTRMRWTPPTVPQGLDAEVQKYLRELNRSIDSYLRGLESPDSLTIDEASITATNGIIFPSGTMSDFADWDSWTPTVSASSGTFTSVSATGKYAVIGGLTFFRVIITITTNGTAASIARFTLPTTATEAAVFYGRETGSAGNQLQGSVAASSAVVDVVTYNNLYPGASGATLTVAGFYV